MLSIQPANDVRSAYVVGCALIGSELPTIPMAATRKQAHTWLRGGFAGLVAPG